MESSEDDTNENETEDFGHMGKSLDKLRDTDPEFYKFLQENDPNLLDFKDDETDEEEVGEDLDEEYGDKSQKGKTEVVTLKLIDEWSEKLRSDPDINIIKKTIKVFKAAVDKASGQVSGQVSGQASSFSNDEFKVEGSDIFNAVINLCLIDLLPAIHKFLKLPSPVAMQNDKDKMIFPGKSKNWKKISYIVKSYLTQMLAILDVVSDSSILSILLKHILYLIPFYLTFVHLTKKLIRKAIKLWSQSEESVRVLCFLCILRISRNEEDKSIIGFILKKAYISYINNCKFTTIQSWPTISFMMHSLVELYSLHQTLAYQHSFVFIKQLAIYLRTALTVKKKESFKSVYNWQYLHSIRLWAHLLCNIKQSQILNPLRYPLIQIIIGTIKLIPSPRHFPMRFHLIKILIKISDETDSFIPILPLITEVFDHLVYSKKHKNLKQDQKELNFDILIKVSEQFIHAIEYKEAVINKLYDLTYQYLSTQSHKIGFPELIQVSLLKIKKFLKANPNIRHLQVIKQLADKIEENSKFISEKRKNVTFGITDISAINAWEEEIKQQGTPINKFYEQWKKLRLKKEKSEIAEEKFNIDLDNDIDNDIETSDKFESKKILKGKKRKKNFKKQKGKKKFKKSNKQV